MPDDIDVTSDMVDAAYNTLADYKWRPSIRRRAAARDDVRDAVAAALASHARQAAADRPDRALETELAPVAPARRGRPPGSGKATPEAKREMRWKHVPKAQRPADGGAA